jgi:hypothetical protein
MIDIICQYNIFSLIFSWFALANIWLTFSIIIDLVPSQGLVFFGGNNHTGLDIVGLSFLRQRITLNRDIDALDQSRFEMDLSWLFGNTGR